ncbi:MAG: hypothetical protein ABIV26_09070 [Candidatus Limnocylindrales bacterium]
MDQLIIVALVCAALGGIAASLSILRRERLRKRPDSPFAASTEGSIRCPTCGMGNPNSERRCISCGASLAG